jgi:hypothetical protein
MPVGKQKGAYLRRDKLLECFIIGQGCDGKPCICARFKPPLTEKFFVLAAKHKTPFTSDTSCYAWPLLSSSGAVFVSPLRRGKTGGKEGSPAKARPLFLYPPQGQAALSVMLLKSDIIFVRSRKWS